MQQWDMMMEWGLLSNEKVPSSRRRLTLGLSGAVRAYNEAAVPGLGGLWFVRQAALAVLGIRVAEKAPSVGSKIAVANAVEALACFVAFEDTGWMSDPRTRGIQKLQRQAERGRGSDFATLSRPSAYVSQPMRMGTVQALPALGLVEGGGRFNTFRTTPAAHELIDAVYGRSRQRIGHATDQLVQWAKGERDGPSPAIRDVLDPTRSPGEAGSLMREALHRGRSERRAAVLRWVTEIDRGSLGHNPHVDWKRRPVALDAEHWSDIRAGALLLHARYEAIQVLFEIEQHLAASSQRRLPLEEVLATTHPVAGKVEDWKRAAQAYRTHVETNGPGRYGGASEGMEFAHEAALKPRVALTALVHRERHLLRIDGDDIVGTGAFDRADRAAVEGPNGPSESEDETGADEVSADEQAANVPHDDVFPQGISPRIRQMRRLALDIDGRLDELLGSDR